MNIPIPILLVINICPPKGTSKDDFPFAKVGYVASLEGTSSCSFAQAPSLYSMPVHRKDFVTLELLSPQFQAFMATQVTPRSCHNKKKHPEN